MLMILVNVLESGKNMCLHLVDLDDAYSNKPENTAAIKSIQIDEVHIYISLVGCDISDLQLIESSLQLVLSYVIIGTAVVTNPQFVQHRSFLGIT